MRLLRVELTRFASRRLVRWGLLVAVLGILAIAVTSWVGARPPSASEVSQAQEYVQQQKDYWAQDGAAQIQDCKDHPENYWDGVDCEHDLYTEPKVEDFLQAPGSFAAEGIDTVGMEAILVAVLALVLGAAFVCAEVASGALGNWLTFEPRRGRVYTSKIAAAAIGAAAFAAVVLLVATGAEWTAFAIEGRAGASGHDWCQLAALAGRAVALAAGLSALGAGLGFFVRHTAAVLGVVAGWMAVVDGAVLGALGQQRWTLRLSGQAWVDGGATYYVEKCTPADGGLSCESVERHVSTVHGGLVLLVVVVVVVGLGWFVFRRRDVS
ncbi:ABC transporter permease subunit [Luteimicrobium subarcticum]|uniref:ABC-2 type transport system permease protein n=1 Tax=Luteimicrobium subarcticum TaxID=620910 RepID=A0A2M8WQK7_9MICO|nr:ABC transporter permease subunit [Luteimicrobium subarcticum]PJI93218.1 ABC-2 type transport system permease protein [Luteimicrobium subarcticum]